MNSQDRIANFSWVLSDLIIDLGTSAMFYRECIYNPDFEPFKNKYHLGKLRMCHMSTIVSLSKLSEALNGFASELKTCCPVELVDNAWKFKEQIENKKIFEFRSKYAAHVFDKESKQPLDLKSGYDRFTAIVGKTPDEVLEFYDWINPRVKTDEDLLTLLANINCYLKNYLGEIPARK
ncbi:hypothetical protein PQI64_04210 [Shewanella bicestrii]